MHGRELAGVRGDPIITRLSPTADSAERPSRDVLRLCIPVVTNLVQDDPIREQFSIVGR